MLDLRPNCELCDKDLPPTATDAMICTYECTFCVSCVGGTLLNVCPNCGGGFERRPVRPMLDRRKGVSLEYHPASTMRVLTKYTKEEISVFSKLTQNIQSKDR